MAQIHVLDEKTINKIAAGEVVERPASVIKELVENSMDAGAHSIEIEIMEGGLSYMRISDDGCGMEEEDVLLSVLRHATSKIRQVEDLYDIASLGFRGEALASISAVSHFSLTTRPAHRELGTRLEVHGGAMEDPIPFGTAVGTTIEVRDLFYNTPARRKFMKTPRTESTRIQDMVGKLALSHPSIAFKLIVDGRVAIITPGTGSLEEAIAALYGFKVAEDIFPIAYEGENIYIEGAVSKPSVIKSNRGWQTMIVNNRVITDKMIFKAIDTAYHALLPKGGYPLVVLNIVVPAEDIDINVHPRKNEVKFGREKDIFAAVYRAILQALEKPESLERMVTNIHYDTAFGRTKQPFEVVKEDSQAFISDQQLQTDHMRGAMLGQEGLGSERDTRKDETKSLYKAIQEERFVPQFTPKYEQEVLPMEGAISEPKSYTPEDMQRFREAYLKEEEQPSVATSELIPLGQVASCYILAKKGDDLYIIDQHAAHERVRFDTLCASAEAIPSEEMLIPLYLPADEKEMQYIEEEEENLRNLGFTVTLGGPTQMKIEAMPIDLEPNKCEEILRYVFSLFDKGTTPTAAHLRHEMLAYASCRGAIKAGHTLNMHQMGQLIRDLFHTEKPYVCPHGRPTIIRFTPDELGKLFLRA